MEITPEPSATRYIRSRSFSQIL